MAPVSFTISNEELFLLGKVLGLKDIPGFEPDIFEGLSQYELGLVLGSAERSLRAREYIHGSEEGAVEIDPVVVALIGSCGIPDVSFLATCTVPGQDTEMCYYHQHQETNTLVEHTFPGPDLHKFEAVDSESEIAERIFHVLKLAEQEAPTCSKGYLQESDLQLAREQIQQQKSAAYDVLVRAGLSEETAREFYLALSRPMANGSFVRIDHRSGSIQGFATLEGPNGLWRLSPQDDTPWIEIEPASAQALRSELEKMIVTDQAGR